jgi:hypothetical protein
MTAVNHTSNTMAKSRKNRGSTSRRKSKSKSKSQKGGWGGWARSTHVGPSWNGNGCNHFALSNAGVPSGKPMPVPAFWGPGMQQANRLVPKLPIGALGSGQTGGRVKRHKRSGHKGRSKRGGFVFGGFPQNIMTGVDNMKIAAQNIYRGFMGTNQLNSASPWEQPALSAGAQQTIKAPQDLSAIRAAAHARVAKIQ